MHIRYLKVMFSALTALMALFYVTQNIVNTQAAHDAIIYVMSGADHIVYPNSFGPNLAVQPGTDIILMVRTDRAQSDLFLVDLLP